MVRAQPRVAPLASLGLESHLGFITDTPAGSSMSMQERTRCKPCGCGTQGNNEVGWRGAQASAEPQMGGE